MAGRCSAIPEGPEGGRSVCGLTRPRRFRSLPPGLLLGPSSPQRTLLGHGRASNGGGQVARLSGSEAFAPCFESELRSSVQKPEKYGVHTEAVLVQDFETTSMYGDGLLLNH